MGRAGGTWNAREAEYAIKNIAILTQKAKWLRAVIAIYCS